MYKSDIENLNLSNLQKVDNKQNSNVFEKFVTSKSKNLNRQKSEILQLNIGKLCNLTCFHCHVNAGPHRKEIITRSTIDKILDWFEKTDIETLDLTGGTPEMIPDFKYLIRRVRSFSKKRKIMDRLNATIINEPNYEWVAEFLAENEVEIIASMPCYSIENVDSQRGDGVFDSSIKAFQKLNKLGYGKDKNLILNFVYNPLGAKLPPNQVELEQDYKIEMKKHFDIVFNNLYCLANMPIARFVGYLKKNNQLEEYMSLLKNSFNPSTVDNLMCKNTINVSWKGEVFDCDFNQMLRMSHKKDDKKLLLWDLNLKDYQDTKILSNNHCFACTAGSGSSCGGAIS